MCECVCACVCCACVYCVCGECVCDMCVLCVVCVLCVYVLCNSYFSTKRETAVKLHEGRMLARWHILPRATYCCFHLGRVITDLLRNSAPDWMGLVRMHVCM